MRRIPAHDKSPKMVPQGEMSYGLYKPEVFEEFRRLNSGGSKIG